MWLSTLIVIAVVLQLKPHFKDDLFAIAAAGVLPLLTVFFARLESLSIEFLLDYGSPLGLLVLSAAAYWWYTNAAGQDLKKSARAFMLSVALTSILVWMQAQVAFVQAIHFLLLAAAVFIAAHISSNAIKSGDVYSVIIWLTPINVVFGIWAFLRHWNVPASEYYSIALALVLAAIFVVLVTQRPRTVGEPAAGRSGRRGRAAPAPRDHPRPAANTSLLPAA